MSSPAFISSTKDSKCTNEKKGREILSLQYQSALVPHGL
jgi:hypothetical protein